MAAEEKTPLRFAGMVAHAFINSKLTPLFIAGALLAGAFAILMTPREEEPQIVVPMLDVFVRMPGATPAEVQQRATIPMERLLREVPGRGVRVLHQPARHEHAGGPLLRWARRKKTRSSRFTTSCIPTSIAYRKAFPSP